MKAFLLVFNFLICLSAWSHCPDKSFKIYETKKEDGGKLTVCGDQKRFMLLQSGQPPEIYPVIQFSDEESIRDRLEGLIGEKKTVDEFSPEYNKALRELNHYVEEQVVETVTYEGVSLLDYLNKGEVGAAPDCSDYYKIELLPAYPKGSLSTVSCQIKYSSIPSYYLSELRKRGWERGSLTLSDFIYHFPQSEMVLTSKAIGEGKQVDPREPFPLKDFSKFDLKITLDDRSDALEGECIDQNFDYLTKRHDPFDLDLNEEERPVYYNDLGESEGSSGLYSAKIAESWRMPVDLSLDSDELKDDKGNKRYSYNVGLQTGLTYKDTLGGRLQVEVSPQVDIPLLNEVTGARDVFRGDSFSKAVPDRFMFNVHIKW